MLLALVFVLEVPLLSNWNVTPYTVQYCIMFGTVLTFPLHCH